MGCQAALQEEVEPVAENKTKPTEVDPRDFVESIEHPRRRADALELLTMMTRASDCEPKMWGPSIVGFGRYRYKYESGREGEHLMTGFSPRKASMVLYVMPGYDDIADELAVLGKHKMGKSCLYVNKLADVDMAVLERIVSNGVAKMRANYQTWDT